MKTDSQIEDKVKQTTILAIPEEEQKFNWRHCWYPVAFLKDLPKTHPYSFSLYNEPFVLFRNADGQLGCLSDRCPHRAAKLSDGQIIDGKIECLYHGWQFGSDGECLHIPQLPADAKIPASACVRSFTVVECQGIVWVWPGEPGTADEEKIPTIADLDKPEFFSADYMGDLPYDQNYLIENLLDPAHVCISHDGSEGNRKTAQPLDMEAIETSVEGIRGRWKGKNNPNGVWMGLNFKAPNLVHYIYSLPGRSGGLALYSIPIGQGRSRLLLRRYGNFLPKNIKQKPRWLEHLRQNRILEEDLPLIVGQQAEIERLGQSLKQVYLPLKTSDVLVLEYRKWLDKFGESLPYYQGYVTSKLKSDNDECNQQPVHLDRLSRHTQLCSSCNRAYQVTNKLKQSLVGVAIALAGVAIVTDGAYQIVAVAVALSFVGLAVVADKLKTKFECSYTRR
ncbi:MAG TPA: Rieske 2Fe-2S domain-containing protein [Candidatus Obscuribacterales bacterium]